MPKKKKIKDLNIYHNNPEYAEKVRKQALARYYRIKQEKLNASISTSTDASISVK